MTVFHPATAASSQNDCRFGSPPPWAGKKSARGGQTRPRLGKTTAISASCRRVWPKKLLFAPCRRRVRPKRQSFWVATAAAGSNDKADGFGAAAAG